MNIIKIDHIQYLVHSYQFYVTGSPRYSERNDAVFRGVQTTALHSAKRFWEVGIRHLTALAERKYRGPDTVVAIMHTCIDLFTLEPRDSSISSGDSYDKLPAPELLS